MKLHLIRPPYKTDSICPPINLMALGAYVESRHPVKMTDFVVPYVRGEMSLGPAGIREAAARLLEHPAQVLGFTSMCSSFAAAVRLAEECKRQDPTRWILFGGPHVSFVATESMKAFPWIDAVIAGEGEGALLDLLDALDEGRPIAGIRNLIHRDGDRIVEEPRRPVVDDMDSLPLPSFHLVENIEDYYAEGTERFIEIEAGRGCPFDCNFCSTSLFFARKYRVKSSGRLTDEIRWLKKNWNIQAFGLIHDNLTSNKDKVRAFCQGIRESGETFSWFCSSRTDTIDRPLMEIMRETGCKGIFFGVETGSQEMQKIVGKRLKMHRVRETFQHLLEVDISSTASFIIGFPDEKLESLEQTLTLALSLRVLGVRDVQLHPLSALPGTQILDLHEEQLVFHPYLLTFHDITSVIDLTEVEYQWIEKYRRIFSNFYAVKPLHYPIEFVYQVRGCYFFLIHFRPYTLSALHALGKLKHIEIVKLLTAKLPADYEQWTHPELERALAAVLADQPPEIAEFLAEVEAYERSILATAEFTSGDNGWVRYKGLIPTEQGELDEGPRLKPCQALTLEFDIPLAVQQLREGRLEAPPRRSLHLVLVFEWQGRRLRTLEVSPLIARILQQVAQGTSLTRALAELSQENPYLSSDDEREQWITETLHSLLRIGLLIDTEAQKEDGALPEAASA